jgi:hypothetical protein
MPINRALISSLGGIPRPMRDGDGIIANIRVFEVAADSNQIINITQMQYGAVLFTGFSAGRNLTTPNGAALTLGFPDMDIGDSMCFVVSIQDAFAGTWVAGDANVILAGRATTPASSWSLVNVTRRADSAGVRQYTWTVL